MRIGVALLIICLLAVSIFLIGRDFWKNQEPPQVLIGEQTSTAEYTSEAEEVINYLKEHNYELLRKHNHRLLGEDSDRYILRSGGINQVVTEGPVGTEWSMGTTNVKITFDGYFLHINIVGVGTTSFTIDKKGKLLSDDPFHVDR